MASAYKVESDAADQKMKDLKERVSQIKDSVSTFHFFYFQF